MALPDQTNVLIERRSYRSGSLDIDVRVMRPRKPGRLPVVLYNHGSRRASDGSVDAGRSTITEATPAWPGVEAGAYAVVFPEGRGYGASTGSGLADCTTLEEVRTFLAGRAQDVVACADWLHGQDWADSDALLLWGCSHGAVVSLLAQASLEVTGTVLQASAVGDQAHEISDPTLLQAVEQTKAPVLIQHARHDLEAPIEFSESLHRTGLQLGKDIRLQKLPFRASISSHAQFDWANRHIWADGVDDFICERFGSSTWLVLPIP